MLKAYLLGLADPVRKTALLLACCILFIACSTPQLKPVRTNRAKGVYHVVKSGETLASIARAYHISIQELAEFNNIENPNLIGINRVIFVPAADQVIDDVMALTSLRKTESPVKTAAKVEEAPKAAVVEKKEMPLLPPVEEAAVSPMASAGPSPAKIRIKPRRDIAHLPSKGEEQLKVGSSPRPKDVPQKPVVKQAEPVQKPVPRGEQTELTKSPQPVVKQAEPVQKPVAKGEQTELTKSPQPVVKQAEPVQKPVAKSEQTDLSKSPPTKSAEHEPVHKTDPDISKPEAESLRFDRKRFIWPIRGKVVSRFGIQPNGMYYNGITISARENHPVIAAADGTIIFSGSLKDYGETIIMKHEDGYATVYTHLGQRKAKLDDHLKKGGQIGMTAEKRAEAQVVFEIRYKNKARNPMFFLP